MNMMHNMLGCRFDNWLRLKRTNPITEKGQARFITVASLALGLPSLLEWLLWHRPIQKTKVEEGPIYVMGFWRSGTTFLQNVLTRDSQYGWFDPVKTLTFNNCILMGRLMKRVMKPLLPNARPMDNMEYALDMPMEETFALATISTQTISHMLVFPDGGNGEKYAKAAFVYSQSEEEQQAWRKKYDYVLRKGTYLCKGKTLLLKSPENSCRIGELKRCYPKAKFINIHRNPYQVIPSAVHMFTKEMDQLSLNEKASKETMERIAIGLFEHVYRKAIPELEAMPDSDRIDIRYDDFCADSMGSLEKIYDQLGLSGFEQAKPLFETYLDSQKNYQKNKLNLDAGLRKKINEKLGFYFDYYGYDMIPD